MLQIVRPMREKDLHHALKGSLPADASALFSMQPYSSAEAMNDLVSCVVRASRRCVAHQHYIQAIHTQQGICLATNIVRPKQIDMTTVASGWAIGRSATCAIRIRHNSISRCHAVIGYHPEGGFYITDLGSSNGTWVNSRALVKMQKQSLQDGDLLKIGKLPLEFFVDNCGTANPNHAYETTYS